MSRSRFAFPAKSWLQSIGGFWETLSNGNVPSVTASAEGTSMISGRGLWMVLHYIVCCSTAEPCLRAVRFHILALDNHALKASRRLVDLNSSASTSDWAQRDGGRPDIMLHPQSSPWKQQQTSSYRCYLDSAC